MISDSRIGHQYCAYIAVLRYSEGQRLLHLLPKFRPGLPSADSRPTWNDPPRDGLQGVYEYIYEALHRRKETVDLAVPKRLYIAGP